MNKRTVQICSLEGFLWGIGSCSEFARNPLSTLHFRICLFHSRGNHTKVRTRSLNSSIAGSASLSFPWTSTQQAHLKSFILFWVVLPDGFFTSIWLRSSTFYQKQCTWSISGAGIQTCKEANGICPYLYCQCLLLLRRRRKRVSSGAPSWSALLGNNPRSAPWNEGKLFIEDCWNLQTRILR